MKRKFIIFITVLCIAVITVVFGYKSFYRSFYPIKYSEYIEKYASAYNLNPYILYAIVKTESGFNPNAVSSVEARGLTQITEHTYSWLVKYRGLESNSFDDMFDPEKNIMFSACLLSYYFEKFSDISAVLSAYHAGMNITEKWLGCEEYSKDGISLFYVPYSDANRYIKSVIKCFNTYEKLYSK